jgi:hypothetical protein
MESTHNNNEVAPLPVSPRARSGVGYEIRVRDHLDPCWWHWFEGWTVTNLDDGEVLLHNASVDQSALHGALNKIRDLNLTLLSVVRERTQSDKMKEKGKPQ